MNERVHWSSRASATCALREWGKWAARRERIPACEQAWVALVVYPNNQRRFDASNYAPTAKALVDGALVDSGVLRDDDNACVPVTVFASGPLWRGAHKHVVLYIIGREPEALYWWRDAERDVHPGSAAPLTPSRSRRPARVVTPRRPTGTLFIN
jgi:hypothetical protein